MTMPLLQGPEKIAAKPTEVLNRKKECLIRVIKPNNVAGLGSPSTDPCRQKNKGALNTKSFLIGLAEMKIGLHGI
jgi:hypothetical protein